MWLIWRIQLPLGRCRTCPHPGRAIVLGHWQGPRLLLTAVLGGWDGWTEGRTRVRPGPAISHPILPPPAAAQSYPGPGAPLWPDRPWGHAATVLQLKAVMIQD